MSVFEAWHLPGVEPGDVAEWEERALPGGGRLRWPLLAAGQTTALAVRLAAHRRELEDIPLSDLVSAVDRVAARLQDPADPLRREAEALLPAVTGFHPAMVALVLDRMSAGWRAPALRRLLDAELAGGAALVAGLQGGTALDGFVTVPGGTRRVRAFGPRLAFHVFAGNVPGVAVTSLVRVLLVRGASLGKTAAREPVLPVLFARALHEEAPALGRTMAVTHWAGGSGAAEDEALAAADVVVGYGGGEAMASLRRRVGAGVRLVEHGPRVSVGIVATDALATEETARAVAAAAAAAVAAVDQQGCVSPQALFVVAGAAVSPRTFAGHLAAALDRLEGELPRARLDASEAAAVHRLRDEAEFRAIAGEPVEILASRGTAWTVVLDATGELRATCLNRFITVHAVPSVETALERLRILAPHLQTVAVAGAAAREELAGPLGTLGASRVTSFEAAPWPPGEGHHDGRGPLRELLRWTDLEDPSGSS